ncbi:MAG: chorismate synthase, partial [Rhodothermaceae bacterium]|nr:chorismate synthase [Rhodothermaceae bacterium]
HVIQIGEVGWDHEADWREGRESLIVEGAEKINDVADKSEVRMLDEKLSRACVDHIKRIKKSGDSLGGVYEVVVTGVPSGLGSYVHWDRRLTGQLAQAILSIQAQKGVEIGDGTANIRRPGSRVHDEIFQDDEAVFRRRSNRAGGLEGGMTNGMPIIVRGYMKPIPTLIKPLETADMITGETQPTRYERSDVTSVPAASTVAEATVAWVIANAFLERYGADTLEEMVVRFSATSRL